MGQASGNLCSFERRLPSRKSDSAKAALLVCARATPDQQQAAMPANKVRALKPRGNLLVSIPDSELALPPAGEKPHFNYERPLPGADRYFSGAFRGNPHTSGLTSVVELGL